MRPAENAVAAVRNREVQSVCQPHRVQALFGEAQSRARVLVLPKCGRGCGELPEKAPAPFQQRIGSEPGELREQAHRGGQEEGREEGEEGSQLPH